MTDLVFRKATKEDLSDIVGLLADDPLGASRENVQDPLSEAYKRAFELIEKDLNQELIVVEDEQEIIGTLQLTFIPYLTYQGGLRSQIEAVRIKANRRSEGIGRKMFEWAIERAKSRGAHVLQLTTDKQRPEALRFYESLGFQATHEGLKLHIGS